MMLVGALRTGCERSVALAMASLAAMKGRKASSVQSSGNEDVINIGVREGETTKYLVNKTLEGLRSVVKAERHFKKTRKVRRAL